MAVYSYAMIVLSFYAVITKSPLDGSISAMYGIAVGAYAYSKNTSPEGRREEFKRDKEGEAGSQKAY